MKATGIVRRIDDLGRVVIPKEIRRTMRIREGEPMEIFTEAGGSVIFRKYSPAGEQSAMAADLCEALFRTSGRPAVICDRDGIVAAAGPRRKELENRPLSPGLESLLRTRQVQKPVPPVPVTQGIAGAGAALLVPLAAEGDVCGCVALLEGNAPLGEGETRLLQAAALFFSRQME